MKVIYLPLNVPGSEQVGTEKGFRLQKDLDLQVFDYLPMVGQMGADYVNKTLIALVQDFKPDWVHSQLQETQVISIKTLETIRAMVPVMTDWNGDIRVEVPAYQQLISPCFDIKYLGYDHLEMYKPYCKQVKYWPIAVDPIEATTFKPTTAPEIVFIGGHYGMNTFPDSQFRWDLMVALSKEFPQQFGVYGSGWPDSEVNALGPVPLKDQGSYYHDAKVVISVNHFNDIAYWSERLLWAFASGTPTVAKRTPNKEFTEGKHFLGFDTIPECIEQVRFLLENSEKGKEIGLAAQDETLRRHCWQERLSEIISDITPLI